MAADTNDRALKDNIFDAPLTTILVLALVAIGGADLLVDNHLSGDYENFVKTIAFIVGPLAIGRGFAARKAG